MSEFESIKVGDEVYIHGRFGAVGRIDTVTHVTPTTFKVGHTVFYRDGGSEKGGGTWNRSCASMPTTEHRDAIWRDNAVRTLNNFNFELIKSNPQMQSILTTVEAALAEYNAAKAARTRG